MQVIRGNEAYEIKRFDAILIHSRSFTKFSEATGVDQPYMRCIQGQKKSRYRVKIWDENKTSRGNTKRPASRKLI